MRWLLFSLITLLFYSCSLFNNPFIPQTFKSIDYQIWISNPVIISHSQIDFGEILINSSSPFNVNLSKSGDQTFNWSTSTDNSWCSLSQTGGTITTGSQTITITVDSTGLADGIWNTMVTIEIDNWKNDTFSLPVTMKVIGTALPVPYCQLSGDGGSDTRITWSGLPTTIATTITLWYFTNDYPTDCVIDFNGQFNQSIIESINTLATFIDPAGATIKADGTYYLRLNNGDISREFNIYKITWDGGELRATEGTLLGSATIIN